MSDSKRPASSSSEDSHDDGWNDPAHLYGHRSPSCVCKEHPSKQARFEMMEMDWIMVRAQNRERIARYASEAFPRDTGYRIESQYAKYEVTAELSSRTDSEIGERYTLWRVTLLGVLEEGSSDWQKLVIGEACSTPAAALESVIQVLFMMAQCEGIEEVIVGPLPVKAEVYSWKKCSVCYNFRELHAQR